MSQNYLISDSISKICNAQKVLHKSTVVNYSKIIYGTLQVMLNEGYIKSVECIDIKNKKYIRVGLKYIKKCKPVINNIVTISKPGKRVYEKYKKLKSVYNNLGISILSTSVGIISNIKAKKIKFGGEIICKVF